MTIICYCDGGTNETHSYGSFSVYKKNSEKDLTRIEKRSIIYPLEDITTHNQAEYQIVLDLVQFLFDSHLESETIKVYSDSQLIIYQLQGKYKLKSNNLIELHFEIQNIISSFSDITFHWVRREVIFKELGH